MFRNALGRRAPRSIAPEPAVTEPAEQRADTEPAEPDRNLAVGSDTGESGGTGGQLATWANNEADLDLLMDLLHEVIDPELGVNIVDLGLIYGVRVVDRVFHVRMTLTTPGCPLSGYIDDSVRTTLSGAPGVDDTSTEIVWDPPWSPDMMSDLAKDQLGWRR